MPDKAARALRRFCLDCQGGHVPSVSSCRDGSCILYPYRRLKPPASGSPEPRPPELHDPESGEAALSGPDPAVAAGEQPAAPADAPGPEGPVPATASSGHVSAEPTLRVIRRFCLNCAGSRAEVRECDARDNCSLWSYRFGVLPATFRRVIARRRKKRTELTLPGLPGPVSK